MAKNTSVMMQASVAPQPLPPIDSVRIKTQKPLPEAERTSKIHNLTFEGGGAKGYCYIGALQVLEEEGICLGGSSGINIAGAIRMARDMGPGKTIVTILCDYGNRYQSKLYNPTFLKEKGLPVPTWLDRAPSNIPTVFEDA